MKPLPPAAQADLNRRARHVADVRRRWRSTRVEEREVKPDRAGNRFVARVVAGDYEFSIQHRTAQEARDHVANVLREYGVVLVRADDGWVAVLK